MKKKSKPPPAPTKLTDWQTGDYSRNAHLRFTIPQRFLLLCKLVNVTPAEMINDFMNNLSFGSWKNTGRERARELLMQYFIEYGYGAGSVSGDDLRSMFKEMEALGLLYPRDADAETIDVYSQWRDAYHEYWFNKWNTRIRNR